MSNKTLLLYGLQRSGTNFLETLLKKTFKVQFLNNEDRSSILQKHCRIYSNKKIIPEPQYYNELSIVSFESFLNQLTSSSIPSSIIVISKDPYSWYLSYLRWGAKCNWPNVSHHYVEEYNMFYNMWVKFSEQTDIIHFIRYVDLISDQNNVILKLKDHFGYEYNNSLMNYLGIFNRINKVPQSSTFTDKKKNYYLNKEYLNGYDQIEFDKINQLIDEKLLSSLGYSKINSLPVTI